MVPASRTCSLERGEDSADGRGLAIDMGDMRKGPPLSWRSNTDRIHAGEGKDAIVGGRAGMNQYPSARVEPR
ncbi:hypothetical protein MBTS_19295 [Methylobacterium bullatum]|nr:hypothetical protein [Methylobacterium bullatum]